MNDLEKRIIESLSDTAENKHPSRDLFGKIQNSLAHAENRNKVVHLYMKRTLSSIALLVIIIGILITSAFISPAMAAVVRNIPIIGSIFEYMGDNGLKDAEKLGVVSTVCQSAEDQGIRITVNDVLYDEARIVVSFNEECKGEFKNFLNESNSLLVNDKLAPEFGIGITQKKASEGSYVGLLTIDISGLSADAGISNDPQFFSGELPNEFILGLHINEIEGIKGTWNFDIPVSKIESKKLTVKFKPNISKTYNGVTHTLDEVIFAPSCVGLTFITEPFGQSGIDSYRVFDDKGNELEVISDSIKDPLYLPVKRVPKVLKIVPYTTDSKNVRIALPKQFPITVSQGNLGEITIQKIEFLTDKTLIYYDFKPKSPSVEPNRIRIERKEMLDSGDFNMLLEGFPKGPGEKLKAPEKTGEYSYIQEYKAIDSNNNLYIVTKQSVDPKPIEAYEITVPLNHAVK